MTFKHFSVQLLFTRGLQRSVPLFGGMDAEFEKAKTRLNTLSTEPGNDVKLQIYGLFKQVRLQLL